MALLVADRVQENTTTTGTGTLTLGGALANFITFDAALNDGDTTYYAIVDDGNESWEVGLGTYSAGTLARTTVYASSNSGVAVNLAAGTKRVFVSNIANYGKYVELNADTINNTTLNTTTVNATTVDSDTVTTTTLNVTTLIATTIVNNNQIENVTTDKVTLPSNWEFVISGGDLTITENGTVRLRINSGTGLVQANDFQEGTTG